jgi:hypothetical protein
MTYEEAIRETALALLAYFADDHAKSLLGRSMVHAMQIKGGTAGTDKVDSTVMPEIHGDVLLVAKEFMKNGLPGGAHPGVVASMEAKIPGSADIVADEIERMFAASAGEAEAIIAEGLASLK